MAYSLGIEVPTSKCPSCDAPLDGATDAYGEETPSPGDISICLYCGHLMAFADDMTTRDLTDAEAHAVAGDKRILLIQEMRVQFLKEKGDG